MYGSVWKKTGIKRLCKLVWEVIYVYNGIRRLLMTFLLRNCSQGLCERELESFFLSKSRFFIAFLFLTGNSAFIIIKQTLILRAAIHNRFYAAGFREERFSWATRTLTGKRTIIIWDTAQIKAWSACPDGQQAMPFCAWKPEGGRMDGQTCLNRHADIRRATDSERHLCRELYAWKPERKE